MYNTVIETHIALDLALQQVNSNRQRSINPEYKDLVLNYAVLEFIETRSNPKTNSKKEGFEDTTKRYDDLKSLKVSKELSYYKNNDTVVSLLPANYKKYIEFGCDIYYSKFKSLTTINKDEYVYYLPFNNDSSNVPFKDLKIYGDRDCIFNLNDYSYYTISNNESKFLYINLILQELNKITGISVYWEYYNDTYTKDTFIIINDNIDKVIHQNYSMTYNDKTVTNTYNKITRTMYNSNGNKINMPVDIQSSDIEFSSNINTYYNKNRYLNPRGHIVGNSIIINEDSNFKVTNVKLIYLKTPTLINYKTNTMCEIPINEEIINMAVNKLQLYLKDESHNINKIIE